MCYAFASALCSRSVDRVRVFLANLLARDMVNFTFADNVKGYPSPVVPDVVHFVFLGNRPLTLVEAICIRAAWLQQRPRRLVLHCQNCSALSLSFYWGLVETVPGLDMQHVEFPEDVLGARCTDAELRTLVALAVLLATGGVYVDRDTYLLSNADAYRRFEMALAWYPEGRVRTELIVAHRNARLLRLLFDAHRRCLSQRSGHAERLNKTDEVLIANSSLMSLFHEIPVATKGAIAAMTSSIALPSAETARMLYSTNCDHSWRELAAVSLMTGSVEQMTETRGDPRVNLVTIASSRTNFGQMARLALSGSTGMGAKNIRDVSKISTLQYAEEPCKY
ncbi:hypothetical protein HPB50_002836 [Hyalomma asiaticum]|uniref:Uncharacterized protein n=1 Tax=Hyalomma asiaticum TaxID=266040 RepID=A0ACB7SDE9_HYAAI|nr:hypothetical protein HPB50_002836 [Hyalomma asiaticum]